MSIDKKELKGLFEKAKTMLKNVDEVITEELNGNEMVEYLKNKAKNVQVKIEDTIKNYTTEEVFADEVDDELIIKLVLSGITKDMISIEVEDTKLLINIKDDISIKSFRKHWSVSKLNLYYDFTQFEESARVENTTSKLENGILTISIPRKERSKEKRKITIQ